MNFEGILCGANWVSSWDSCFIFRAEGLILSICPFLGGFASTRPAGTSTPRSAILSSGSLITHCLSRALPSLPMLRSVSSSPP